jgi:hypothetical protein
MRLTLTALLALTLINCAPHHYRVCVIKSHMICTAPSMSHIDAREMAKFLTEHSDDTLIVQSPADQKATDDTRAIAPSIPVEPPAVESPLPIGDVRI